MINDLRCATHDNMAVIGSRSQSELCTTFWRIYIVETFKTMLLQIQKWGNSLAVRIPSQVAKNARLNEGSEINLREEGGRIILDRVERDVLLAELLAAITPDNLHGEADFGPARGKEIW